MANATALRVGQTSTTAIKAVQAYRVDFTVPALSSGGSAASSVTVSGLTTNSVYIIQPRVALNSSIVGVQVNASCSTLGSLHLEFSNNSISTLTGSTQSGVLLQFQL